MTASHWLRGHTFTSPDQTCDILIVGGGYVGLSTAYWLSEYRPDLKITVLERSHCGAGASGRNAGFLTMGSASFFKSLNQKWGHEKALSIFQFAEESLKLVHQHILSSSPEIKFERTSSMTLFHNEESYRTWSEGNFKPHEFNFQWRENSSLSKSLQPHFFGAYENGPEYKINPVQLLSTLKKLLESRKVQIIENVSGFELTSEGVLTEVNKIKAKQVILALNGYFPQFHPVFKNLITPRRAQMIAVELEEDIDCASLYYDPPERVYWRKASEKVLLVGGKRLLDEEGEVGEFDKVSSKVQHGLEDYLQHQLKLKYKVINRWSGTMGFTEHELPLITKVAAPLDTIVVGGFSGHGMGFGFRSARETAELALGQIQHSFFDSFKETKISL